MNALLLAVTLWQCNAKAAIDPTTTFIGQGRTRAGAAAQAQASCYAHLHVACYVQSCKKR